MKCWEWFSLFQFIVQRSSNSSNSSNKWNCEHKFHDSSEITHFQAHNWDFQFISVFFIISLHFSHFTYILEGVEGGKNYRNFTEEVSMLMRTDKRPEKQENNNKKKKNRVENNNCVNLTLKCTWIELWNNRRLDDNHHTWKTQCQCKMSKGDDVCS